MNVPAPSYYEIAIVIHLLGVALGTGGAIITDMTFMNMIRTGKFRRTSIDMISLLSSAIWLGVFVIIASGAFLYFQDEHILQNPQFLAKMTIVFIILLNGTVFHFYHLPLLKKLTDKPIKSITEHKRRRELLLISGAFSSTSWIAAIAMGSTLYRSWDYLPLVGIYLTAVIGASSLALALRGHIIPNK